MQYDDLDKDTKGIIEAMCENTGLTKEVAILTLVEFGMLSMKAAVSSNHPFNNQRKKVMKVIYDAVEKHEGVKKTAEGYDAYWSIPE